MKNDWSESEVEKLTSPLELRVYSSRLIGKNPSLVLHGGGNTSVKIRMQDGFGVERDVLFVKGSGSDLAHVTEKDFALVDRLQLLTLVARETLSDTEMVRLMRSASLYADSPVPSIEAIMHAVIPFAYVDHTHADAIVALSNSPLGYERIKEIAGQDFLILPYVKPGFLLTKAIAKMLDENQGKKLSGIILLHHGVFTFANTARESYEKMIQIVSRAEEKLKELNCSVDFSPQKTRSVTSESLCFRSLLRKKLSEKANGPVLIFEEFGEEAQYLSSQNNLENIFSGGTLTPEHVIYLKPRPLILDESMDLAGSLSTFDAWYESYFKKYARPEHTKLISCPRWVVLKDQGFLAVGRDLRQVGIIFDIARHNARAMSWSFKLGGWKALSEADLFEIEYWELEQAKLRRQPAPKPFAGKIALVTGAASGIGAACVREFLASGCVVAGMDISPEVFKLVKDKAYLPFQGDLRDTDFVKKCIDDTVRKFGGLDLVICNAGIFTQGQRVENISKSDFQKSIDINLTANFSILQNTYPYLKNGIDPSVIIIGSKNVKAPGKGAASYSAAKAALTQLARVTALEWASDGIRVNVVHPNAVFDTAIWTPETLSERALAYGVGVEDYKKMNLLGTEILSSDVASMVVAMAGPIFSKTTGAQIPIDGGNDRVL